MPTHLFQPLPLAHSGIHHHEDFNSLTFPAALSPFSWTVRPASLLPESLQQKAQRAEACAVADLVYFHTVTLEGQMVTRFVFQTVEALKGDIPDYVEAHAPGGEWGDEVTADSRMPKLTTGQKYVLFLVVEDGLLRIRDGFAGAIPSAQVDLKQLREICAPLSSQTDLSPFARDPMSVSAVVTTSGLLESNGARRFALPDQGRSIPVIADVSTLPSGITPQQALDALQNALDAWEAVCTLRFNIVGTETFPQSADDYTRFDGMVIRVQMHDNFNKISNSSSTLAFGGAGFLIDAGAGATVDGLAFNPIQYGYVIMDHPKSTLENPVAFEEVLAHELGHVIGMAHSSETVSEPDSEKAEAIMYFQVHNDGRGADIRTYDINTILQSHPVNIPPYSFTQKFNAVTIPNGWTLANPEVNQVVIEGFDLNGDSTNFVVTSSSTDNGSFSVNGNTVTYTPSGYFSDVEISDPSQSFYDRAVGYISDGVNQSPPVEIWIIGFLSDSWPSSTPDGIPDSWMNTYYGSISGTTATSDTDLDTFNTLQEYRMDTDPEDADSKLKITGITPGEIQWEGRRFDLYRIQSRPDLSSGNWTTLRLDSEPENLATFTSDDLPEAAPGEALFFRVERVQ